MSSDNYVNPSKLRHRMIGATSYGVENSVDANHPDIKAVPMLDVSLGMLHGYQPRYGAYVSNTGYTPRNVIPVLLEAPRGFAYLPSPGRAVAVLKNLMETQAKTITGLRSGYNVEFTERQVSGAGHMQSDPSNVTEEISAVSYTWDDRYGKAIQSFWMHYIRNVIADPTTKQPGVMNMDNGGDEPTDQLADFYSFTMLFIEPDPLRRYAVDAWLINNMVPKSSGVHEVGYDKAADFAVPEVSIEFTGMPVQSMGIKQVAQEILDGINYLNAGPIQQASHVSYTSKAILEQEEMGYREELSAMAESGNPFSEDGGFGEAKLTTAADAPGAVDTTFDQTGNR